MTPPVPPAPLVPPVPLALPRLSRPDARALAAAAAAIERAAPVADALSMALGETVALAGPPRIARDYAREGVRVTAGRGDARASVWLPAALALEALNRLLPRAEIAAPRALAAAERGALAHLALVALRAIGGGWRLVEVADAPAPAVEPSAEPALKSAPEPALAPSVEPAVEIDARAFGLAWGVRLAPPDGAAATAPAWPLLHAAPQDVAIVVGAARLAAAEVASLGVGDVVVPDRLADVRRGGGVVLACGRLRADARIEEGRLRVSSGWALHGGTTMDDARAALAAGLEVEMVAEAGRIRLTGREVLDLRPGAVLPLSRRVGDPIDLCCGGRVVARAELCDLGGDLGLRIVEVLPAT